MLHPIYTTFSAEAALLAAGYYTPRYEKKYYAL